MLAACVGFAVAVGSAVPARAAARAPDAPRVRVEIDASEFAAAAEAIAAQVDQGATAILEGNGFARVEDETAPLARLTITNLDGEAPGYRVSYGVWVDGAVVEGTSASIDCRMCTETELVETAQASIELLMPKLRESSPPAAVEEETDPTADPVAPNGTSGDPAKDSAPAGGGLGTLGKAGVAVAVVGGAALIPGIVLAVLPPKPLPDADQRNTLVPGAALAAVGGAALVTGVVLIVVDRVRAKRARPSTSMRPTLLLRQDFAAVGLQRRF